MSSDKICEIVTVFVEPTRISKAGRGFSSSTGKFERLPKDYFIKATGKKTKKGVPFSRDYKAVQGFSDVVEVFNIMEEEGCSVPGANDMIQKTLNSMLGSPSSSIKNIEGKKSVVTFAGKPLLDRRRSPKGTQPVLELAKMRGDITGYQCFPTTEGTGCMIDILTRKRK